MILLRQSCAYLYNSHHVAFLTKVPFKQIQYNPVRQIFKSNKKCCNKSLKDTSLKIAGSSLQNTEKDVVLFVADNQRFFSVMNMFALSQFIFWNYIGTALLDMKSVEIPRNVKENSDLHWWQKYDFAYYKKPMAVFSFIAGLCVLSGCWLHSLRTVKHIVLRKGGQHATLATYAPFGKTRYLTIPLDNVSATSGRAEARGSYASLKVKGRSLHYLVDMDGNFVRPMLYDKTVGVRRNFAAQK